METTRYTLLALQFFIMRRRTYDFYDLEIGAEILVPACGKRTRRNISNAVCAVQRRYDKKFITVAHPKGLVVRRVK